MLQQEADPEGIKSVNKCNELVSTVASKVGKKIYEADQSSSSIWENDIRPEYPHSFLTPKQATLMYRCMKHVTWVWCCFALTSPVCIDQTPVPSNWRENKGLSQKTFHHEHSTFVSISTSALCRTPFSSAPMLLTYIYRLTKRMSSQVV